LTCFDIDGKTIASTNLTRLVANVESPITQMHDGRWTVVLNESDKEYFIVPIMQEFDEAEQIGLLVAVIDRYVFRICLAPECVRRQGLVGI